MKKLIAPILVAFACFAFSACNNSTKKDKEATTTLPDIKKVVDEHPGVNAGSGTFSITAPDGWSKKDTIISGAKLTTISSPDDGNGDKFKENVNVVTESAKGYDLKAYVTSNRTSMSGQIASIQFLSDIEGTVGSEPAEVLLYSFNYSGYDLKNTAYFIVKNDIGYVITCTALKTTFDRFQKDFKTIVDSFKIN